MSTNVTFAGSTPAFVGGASSSQALVGGASSRQALVGGASSHQEKRYIRNDGPGSQLIGQVVMTADVFVGLDSVHTSHMSHACFRSG